MASAATKKGKKTEVSLKGFEDFEYFKETLGQAYDEDSLQFLEELKNWTPDKESKLMVGGWKEDEKQRQEAAQFADVEMEKKLKLRSLKDFQKKSYDEGDQSPLVGRDAWILQRQWSHKMDYNPLKPFSRWMKVIYTGDYERMMDIVHNTSDVTKLLSMRESLMNVPALIHVVLGATTLSAEEPLSHDHMKVLEKLIELGADLSVRDVAGKTFLHNCFAGTSNPTTRAMAELVLKAGLDPNIQDRFGGTPLFAAVCQHNLTDIELLLKYGANPCIKEYEHGESCLNMAQMYPAINKLMRKYMCRDALRERNKLKEECGGSLSKCLECGKDKATRCKGCFVAHYCNKACQKKGWKAHKADCKATRAQFRSAILVPDSPFLSFIPAKGSDVGDTGSPPEGYFVVKVQVLNESSLGDTKLPILIFNRGHTLRGGLEREEGQEELYDKLKKEVLENGFNGCTGFFPAIYQKDCAGSVADRLEINPDQMLPIETW